MTPPIRPESEFDRWKAEQEFNAWKQSQANASIADVNALSARLARASEREQKSAEERRLGRVDRVGAALQTATDMMTGGLSGLADDAMSALAARAPLVPGSFAEQFRVRRQARTMGRQSLSTPARVASTVGGLMLNPMGTILKVPAAGASALVRGSTFAAENALQGGVTGAIENLEDVSPEGLRQAGEAGLMSAAVAVPAAAGMRGVLAGVRGATTLRDVIKAKPLDVVRNRMQDDLAAMDAVNFGRVRGEAVGPATREVSDVLNTQTIAPFAQMVRNSEEFAGANDNVILLEAYKRMSEAQRKSARAQEGTAELLAGIAQKGRDIGIAKGRMLQAADPSIPSLRPANAAHATARGEIEVFENTADAIQRIINKRAQRGEKILFDSPEALRRGIAQMTPNEAKVAYQAVLGRTREVMKLSANPLTGFGVPGAVIRTTIAPSQINPYLRLLEKQAGVKPSFFNNPVTADRAGLLGARAAGAIDY